MLIVPKVTRMSGIFKREMKRPLITPVSSEHTMAPKSASAMTVPGADIMSSPAMARMSTAIMMPLKLAVAMMERLMPPESIATIMPSESRPRIGT